MPARLGRLEKRIRLAVPVEILNPQNPSAAERTTTENVSSLGMRVLTQRARDLNERLMIRSLGGDLQTLARVVYCQHVAENRFALGLELSRAVALWARPY
jgi:hypothetical protein